ncbi:uncharacterized protein B0H18DRAFT_955996 [Fomitopsis serialis]|uniref:uncharacterized protein n=1 Tax=Fomitopsis serialis TaxID=139415 RepID=UPI002007D1FE|nr:uncharacterized protein B0H18DRAFT_955996 [Neoantrodia serialis]KAH9923072.1 hypothetical protein B0H18DRAFT_955996 [Neoantrodia serialis]
MTLISAVWTPVSGTTVIYSGAINEFNVYNEDGEPLVDGMAIDADYPGKMVFAQCRRTRHERFQDTYPMLLSEKSKVIFARQDTWLEVKVNTVEDFWKINRCFERNNIMISQQAAVADEELAALHCKLQECIEYGHFGGGYSWLSRHLASLLFNLVFASAAAGLFYYATSHFLQSMFLFATHVISRPSDICNDALSFSPWALADGRRRLAGPLRAPLHPTAGESRKRWSAGFQGSIVRRQLSLVHVPVATSAASPDLSVVDKAPITHEVSGGRSFPSMTTRQEAIAILILIGNAARRLARRKAPRLPPAVLALYGSSHAADRGQGADIVGRTQNTVKYSVNIRHEWEENLAGSFRELQMEDAAEEDVNEDGAQPARIACTSSRADTREPHWQYSGGYFATKTDDCEGPGRERQGGAYDLMEQDQSSFVVKRCLAFQGKENLCLVMVQSTAATAPRYPVARISTQERACNYVAEAVLDVERLYRLGTVHRDVKSVYIGPSTSAVTLSSLTSGILSFSSGCARGEDITLEHARPQTTLHASGSLEFTPGLRT